MSNQINFDSEQTENCVETAIDTIWGAACDSKNDTFQLLAILRTLENLHQQIRDTIFQESLPSNRQALYVLLKDIEAKGGWPYIYRTKLRELMDKLAPDELNSHDSSTGNNSPSRSPN